MANRFTNLNPTAKVGMTSVYRMSDAPPNWAQDDPTQPDYIKNKQEAEKLRPIYVNGQQILDDTHESGPLNLVAGDNVSLSVDGNNVVLNASVPKQEIDSVRPIYVEGNEFLNKSTTSGGLNLKAGNNIILTASKENNSITISALGSGGEEQDTYGEIIDSETIDVEKTLEGQTILTLQKGSITDDYIDSISVNKLIQSEDEILILNGGKANGYN